MIQAVLNNTGLILSEIEKMRSVFKKYAEIEAVLIYGSRSKGNYKPYSDIDLSLVGKELSLTVQYKIENDLDDLLMPYKCDLSIYNTIQNKDLTAHIERVGQRFYEQVPLRLIKD
jgi:type I restriction enzyme S subunit